MLLPWIVKNFNVNPILLIRHPCAVVNSQIRHGNWNHIGKEQIGYIIPNCNYNEHYLIYSDILNKVKTIEEKLAATWALTMVYSVLNINNNKKWITVAYENLYKNSEDEVTRIFNRLNLTIPDNIYKKISSPSFTTKEESINKIRQNKQLESWKMELSITQQKRVLNIIKEFNIDFYDSSLEPDYNKIYN